jgi:hypothetical protein
MAAMIFVSPAPQFGHRSRDPELTQHRVGTYGPATAGLVSSQDAADFQEPTTQRHQPLSTPINSQPSKEST